MTVFEKMVETAGLIAVVGHVNPDGDCVGSTLGVYNYIRDNFEGKEVDVYLEKVPEKFSYLSGYDIIRNEPVKKTYDLCVCIDTSDVERLGEFRNYFRTAKATICIDHHVTNPAFAQVNVIDGSASSACEVLFSLLDEDKIDKSVAECIYTGIIHDTGVFKYSCTSPRTMEIAGKMMAKGIDYGTIIDSSFFAKNYPQTLILGKALERSVRFLNDRCIYSVITKEDMDSCGALKSDLDGIVDQLRVVDGVEVAVFLYDTEGKGKYKVSLRSDKIVDVSVIASVFGGGGHEHAAGCNLSGSVDDMIDTLSVHIKEQLDAGEG